MSKKNKMLPKSQIKGLMKKLSVKKKRMQYIFYLAWKAGLSIMAIQQYRY